MKSILLHFCSKSMPPLKQAVLIVGGLILFQWKEVVGQPNLYPPMEQVADEFTAMLKRPATNLSPSLNSFNTDSVLIEKGFIYSEASEKVPLLIYKPIGNKSPSLPVVICLHGTGGSKDNQDIRNFLYQLAKKGFMAVAIDARYHGERIPVNSGNKNAYVEAITKAWLNKDLSKQEHPFFYDTVYDLWKLTDYLLTRNDVDPSRIGMTGISMGGIETWMAASVDTRIKVAVPIIAAQSFRWSLENNRWQGRARTIWGAHEAAAKDLGDTVVTQENVRVLWEKLLPGILDKFDCPSMIRLFAPRPLLLLNNGEDQNCPLPGAQIAFESAKKAYQSNNAPEKLMIVVTPNEPHRLLPAQVVMAIGWFVKWL